MGCNTVREELSLVQAAVHKSQWTAQASKAGPSCTTKGFHRADGVAHLFKIRTSQLFQGALHVQVAGTMAGARPAELVLSGNSCQHLQEQGKVSSK